MPEFLIYSLKVSVGLMVVLLFYQLALRNLTFFTWNRWYFLGATFFTVVIPAIEIPFLISQEAYNVNAKIVPVLNNLAENSSSSPESAGSFSGYVFPLIALLILIGIVVLGVRLLVQIISFLGLFKHATLLQKHPIKIYHIEKAIAPFSFGQSIFLNSNLLQPTELKEIVEHERIHVLQHHTLDVLWLEILVLINWYNPFAWLLKHAVRQNLEFIVDKEVVCGLDLNKKYYQYLLLKVIGLPNFSIANQFNISSLKNRIKMMNRMPSKKQELGKFLLVLPLMAGLLLACGKEDLHLSSFETPPPPPTLASPPPVPAMPEMPPPPPPIKIDEFVAPFISHDVLPADHKEFIKRNPSVKNLAWNLQGKVLIYLKSGEQELYDLTNSVSAGMAENKFGKLPKHPNRPPFFKYSKEGKQIR